VTAPEPAAKPRRGRPAKTSKDDVVRVAREIVLTEGFDALSVRRIATELGVTPFTVQFQSGTKDELLDEVIASLLNERSFSPNAFRSWRKGLVYYGESMFALVTEHPAVCESIQRRVVAPGRAMDALERVVTLAEREGLTIEQIASYYNLVWCFVTGFASTIIRREDSSYQPVIARIATKHPRSAAVFQALDDQERDERFRTMLTTLVDSLGR
jgi:AcrR family transcriptional regulator